MTFIANALGIGPAQQAQVNQAQQNYAQGVSSQASQTAQAQQLYNWVQMMQNYQAQINQNPNPANTWKPLQAPNAIQGTIGGGQVGSNGSVQGQGMPQGQPQNLMGQFGAGAQGGMQQPQQGQQLPDPQQSNPFQGIPAAYIRQLLSQQQGQQPAGAQAGGM